MTERTIRSADGRDCGDELATLADRDPHFPEIGFRKQVQALEIDTGARECLLEIAEPDVLQPFSDIAHRTPVT